MTGERVCVTNLVGDLRSCVVRGTHLSNCDGWARRYDLETQQTRHAYRISWDPATRENVRTLIECPGCLPREAEIGFLCSAHVAKLRHALSREDGVRILVGLVSHLWSSDAAGVSDGNDRVAAAFGSRWPLAEARVTGNEIWRALDFVAFSFVLDVDAEPPRRTGTTARDGLASTLTVQQVATLVADVADFVDEHWEQAASHSGSAAALVRFVGVLQTALARFPLVDTEHRIPAVRCPSCGRMSMIWRPPLFHEDEVEIRCERDECGHVADQDWLEHYIAAVRTDPRRRRA